MRRRTKKRVGFQSVHIVPASSRKRFARHSGVNEGKTSGINASAVKSKVHEFEDDLDQFENDALDGHGDPRANRNTLSTIPKVSHSFVNPLNLEHQKQQQKVEKERRIQQRDGPVDHGERMKMTVGAVTTVFDNADHFNRELKRLAQELSTVDATLKPRSPTQQKRVTTTPSLSSSLDIIYPLDQAFFLQAFANHWSEFYAKINKRVKFVIDTELWKFAFQFIHEYPREMSNLDERNELDRHESQQLPSLKHSKSWCSISLNWWYKLSTYCKYEKRIDAFTTAKQRILEVFRTWAVAKQYPHQTLTWTRVFDKLDSSRDVFFQTLESNAAVYNQESYKIFETVLMKIRNVLKSLMIRIEKCVADYVLKYHILAKQCTVRQLTVAQAHTNASPIAQPNTSPAAQSGTNAQCDVTESNQVDAFQFQTHVTQYQLQSTRFIKREIDFAYQAIQTVLVGSLLSPSSTSSPLTRTQPIVAATQFLRLHEQTTDSMMRSIASFQRQHYELQKTFVYWYHEFLEKMPHAHTHTTQLYETLVDLLRSDYIMIYKSRGSLIF